MMTVDFITMNDLQHKAKLLSMMHALYGEDEAASPVDQSRFSASVESLVAHPLWAASCFFDEGGSLCGYTLLALLE